jgi:hypothetical protein
MFKGCSEEGLVLQEEVLKVEIRKLPFEQMTKDVRGWRW